MALEARVLDIAKLEPGSREEVRKPLNRRESEHVISSLARMCDFSRDIKSGKKPDLVVGQVTEFGVALQIFSDMNPSHPIAQKHPDALVRLYNDFDVVDQYTRNRTKPKPSLSRYLERELRNYKLLMDIVNVSVLRNVIKNINDNAGMPREIRLIKFGQNGDYGGGYRAYKIESGEIPSLQRHTLEKKVDYSGLMGILGALMLTRKSKPRDIRILYDGKEALFEVYVKH